MRKHTRKEHVDGFKMEKIKYYKYHCNVCGWDSHWVDENHVHNKKVGCACCNGKTVAKGINDVATTHPHLVKYFKNQNEAFMYTAHSDYCPELICPNCGYIKTEMRIRSLTKQGFGCNGCDDGISYPEKFIHALLKQLNVEFKPQLTKNTYEWCDKYKYDFWFKYKNEEYIIEAHGAQHYHEQNRWPQSLLEIQDNDRKKEELANNNGFYGKHYIVLDCRESHLIWIKKSVVGSVLAEIFDLTKIEWDICHEKGCSSLIHEMCKYWEDNKHTGITASIVAKHFNCSDTTVRKYLNIGTRSGWCEYNGAEENIRTSRMAAKNIIVFNKKMEFIKIFNSAREIAEQSVAFFGMEFKQNTILQTCNIKSHRTDRYFKGYYFWYLEDYIKEFGEDSLPEAS